MQARNIAPGMSLVEVPEAGLSLLCGCPENSVKHLMKAGAMEWREAQGKRYETGPNAILLSERPIINGRFANAAEFPVLQMLYRQGMIIPGSPANTGRRPMLIGLREQLEAQARYIHLGNYGLSSLEDLVASGLSPELARERLNIKLGFSFGTIKPVRDLLDLRVVDARAVELRDGVFIHRLGVNRYAILYEGRSVEVDLEVRGEGLKAPYTLPRSSLAEADFSVIHLGEGDGWDPERPCIGAMLKVEGRLYLVDAGPDIAASLEAVGLDYGDLSGIFHTHVHDDHFIGLASLFRAPRRLAYYAVPWVRSCAAQKLSALAGITEEDFCRYFEVHDLVEGQWNSVEGLEVKPIHSPQPVETSIMRFRYGGKTYAHWADLSSFRVLDSFVREDHGAPGMSAAAVAQVKADYLEPADLKKLDVGGGMIHGEADDFAQDASRDLLLSHTDSPNAVSRPFGRVARFGEESILVAARRPQGPKARLHASPDSSAKLLLAALPGVDLGHDGLLRLSLAASRHCLAPGADLGASLGRGLCVLDSGRAELLAAGEVLTLLGPADLFGEESALYEEANFFQARASGDLGLVFLPAEALAEFPSLLWRLKEVHESRLSAARASFHYVWRPEYSVRVPALDLEHQGLFAAVASISRDLARGLGLDQLKAEVEAAQALALRHYADEEALMRAANFPSYLEHKRVHEEIIAEVEAQLALLRQGLADPCQALEEAKERLLTHSLLMDRQYIPWLLGERQAE